MANWWETEPDAPPQMAEWQRRVASYQQELTRARNLTASEWRATVPSQQPLQQPQQAQGWQAPAWYQALQPQQQAQPAQQAQPRGGGPYSAAFRAVDRAYQIRLGHPLTQPVSPIVPPGAEDVREPWWERRVGESYLQRGEEAAKKLFPWYGREESEGAPDWLRQTNDLIEQINKYALARLIRAWEYPEQRALLGGVPGSELASAEELGQPPEKKGMWAQIWEHLTEPGERRTQYNEKLMDLYAQQREAETDAERDKIKAQIAELNKSEGSPFGPSYPIAGKTWEELTEGWEPLRWLERVGAVGIQFLQEGAFAMEELGGGLDIISREQSRNLTVEQWFPLAQRYMSLFYYNAKDAIDISFQAVRGEIPFEEWKTRQQALMPGGEDYLLSRSLTAVAEGRASAEEIALAYENLGAEIVGQILVDPFNLPLLQDLVFAKQSGIALTTAQAKMLEPVMTNKKAIKALGVLDAGLAKAGLGDVDEFQKVAKAAGVTLDPGTLEKVKDIATKPFQLTPEAKVVRDLEEITTVLSPVIELADTGDDALRLLRMWADDPESLAPIFGRTTKSLPAAKAQSVLSTFVDLLEDLPSIKAKPFNPVKFWVDLDSLAHVTLRAAYGFKEPGKIQRFFLAYKRAMSEVYLNAATSPGYVMRNTLTDLSGMANDGLLTFEHVDDINRYFDAFGEIRTRRMMTEGAASREALTGQGEIKSMFPGPLGEYSKKGQEITRFGEPFGRLPIGEESRYRRAVYMGLKRYWNENAANLIPDLPKDVRAALGNRAEHLRLRIANDPSITSRRQALTDFLDGTKGQQFEPTRYLDPDDLDAMSPAVLNRLRKDLGKLTTESSIDDVHEVMDAVRAFVDEDEAVRLAAMEDLPARIHVTTDIDEAELADALIDDLQDVVARTGSEELAEQVEEIKKAIPKIEEELDTARAEAFQDLIEVPDRDGLEILLRANADAEDLRNTWRQKANRMLQKAKAAYDATPRMADDIWRSYGRRINEGWTDLARQRIQRFRQARDELGRLRAGESVDDILGDTKRVRAEERLLKASEIPERPADYLPGKVLRSADDEKFAQFRDWHRAVLDNSRHSAWRTIYGTDPRDYGKALDLLDSADRDVDQLGKIASAKVQAAIEDAMDKAQKVMRYQKDPHMRDLAVEYVWEKYWGIRNDIWNEFWETAEKRWGIAERDIMWENYTRSRLVEDVPTPTRELPPAAKLQPGDEDLVKAAVTKPDEQWTPEERAAIERWTRSGQGLPQAQESLGPGHLPAYTREEFHKDLANNLRLTPEQSRTLREITDAMAETWSKRTGFEPGSWYTRYFAGSWRGHPPAGVLWQSAPDAPRWWYKAEDVIGTKMPNSATVEQVRNILTKGGIKKDELRWNGVLRWLDNQKGMITKDDVLGYLQANRIVLEELVTPHLTREIEVLQARYEAVSKVALTKEERLTEALKTGGAPMRAEDLIWQARHQRHPRAIEIMEQTAPNEWREAKEAWKTHNSVFKELEELKADNVTKWENYVEPGAEPGTYQEFRLVLPWEQVSEPISFEEWLKATGMPEEMWERPSVRRAYEHDLADPTSAVYGPGGALHKEPHWEEPNVIGHVRFNARTTPDGERVLFIEELQSQWHQQARKAGYRPGKWPEGWSVRKATKNDRYRWKQATDRVERLVLNTDNELPTEFQIVAPRHPRDHWQVYHQDRQIASYTTAEEARKAVMDSLATPTEMAAFDEKGRIIGWGTSEASAKRAATRGRPPNAPFSGTWDELLLKRMMRWASDNDFDAIAWTNGAHQAIRYPTPYREVVDELRWMRHEDGTVYVKGLRWGDSVFEIEFPAKGTVTFLEKETTLERALGKDIARQIAETPFNRDGHIYVDGAVVGDRALADIYDRILPYSSNKLIKRWKVGVEPLSVSGVDETVTGFRIPQNMKRDLVSEGLPLFQGDMSLWASGATDFLTDGRAVMRFFESADFSTALHEIAHVALTTMDSADLAIIEKWAGLNEGEFLRLHQLYVENANLARRGVIPPEPSEWAGIGEMIDQYTKAQEKWARGFERYMAEGVAPTPELARAFERCKQWLLDIYHRITNSSIDVDLNNNVREVMDRLLAENPRPRGAGERPLFQAAAPTQTGQFKRFFRNSTAVDEAGEPLRLYHGTSYRFDQFEPGRTGLIWFSDEKLYAEAHIQDPNVMEVFVRAESPLDLTNVRDGMTKAEFDREVTAALQPYGIKYGTDVPEVLVDEFDEVLPYAWVNNNGLALSRLGKERGFDSIIVKEKYWPFPAYPSFSREANSYIVFDPDQVQIAKGLDAPLWQRVGEEAPRLPGLGREALAEKALTEATSNGGFTLALNGNSPSGGYAVAIYPGAERTMPIAETTAQDIAEYLDEWGHVLINDQRAHLGGWVDEGTFYLDLSAVIDNPDEAMLVGWKNHQKALFNLETFEDVPVTRSAAEAAADRLGQPLPARPMAQAATPVTQRPSEQLGFWNVDPDNWRQYRQAMNSPGATPGPLPPDILQRSTDATRRSLDKIEDGIGKEWDQWQGVITDQSARAGLEDWFTNEVTPNWYEQRAVAFDYARSVADHALLDYAHRRNLDTWMAYVFPYHFWFTRAGKNWAQRVGNRPGLLSSYIRMRDAQKLANENAGRRRRFEEMFRVPFPWLPQWMGDSVYVDPLSLVMPFGQIWGTNWDDSDDAKRGLRSLYGAAQRFGFRPYHLWDYLYQSGTFQKAGEMVGMSPESAQDLLGPQYPNNFPFVLPQTNVVRGVTSLARELGAKGMPPGGINIEAPMRTALGLPAGEIWDPYRINRELANLSAERPQDMELATAALRAQELVARDTQQTGKVWDRSSELAQQVATEMNWSADQLAQAQDLLAKAMQRATLERGVGTIGWAAGPRMAVEPTGERAQLEMAEQARGQIYTPGTPEGSREAYEQFKGENPAMYPRSTQYNVLPGEQEFEAMAPGARANWLLLRGQKEMLHDEYDRAVDDLLRENIWDWDGRNELEARRRAAIAEVEAKYPLPEMTGDIPAILYGMSPAEMWDSTVEKELYQLEAMKPDPSSFETKEGVDWDAWRKAETKWRAQLPKSFTFGQVRGGVYASMDPTTAMRNFEQRYDSPLEAAHEVYQSDVASPAWNKYNQAKAQEEKQWPGMKALQDKYWTLPENQRGAFFSQHPELGDYWDWKDQRGPSAYERIIGNVGAMPATALIPAILARYKTKGWTEEELKEQLGGVVFPPLMTQQDLKRGAQTQQVAAGAAQAAAGGGYGGSRAYSQYSPAELNYLKNKILREWNARQGRNAWRGGGYTGGGRSYGGGYASQGSSRWRQRPTIQGGPWEGLPGAEIWGGPFRG